MTKSPSFPVWKHATSTLSGNGGNGGKEGVEGWGRPGGWLKGQWGRWERRAGYGSMGLAPSDLLGQATTAVQNTFGQDLAACGKVQDVQAAQSCLTLKLPNATHVLFILQQTLR